MDHIYVSTYATLWNVNIPRKVNGSFKQIKITSDAWNVNPTSNIAIDQWMQVFPELADRRELRSLLFPDAQCMEYSPTLGDFWGKCRQIVQHHEASGGLIHIPFEAYLVGGLNPSEKY